MFFIRCAFAHSARLLRGVEDGEHRYEALMCFLVCRFSQKKVVYEA